MAGAARVERVPGGQPPVRGADSPRDISKTERGGSVALAGAVPRQAESEALAGQLSLSATFMSLTW